MRGHTLTPRVLLLSHVPIEGRKNFIIILKLRYSDVWVTERLDSWLLVVDIGDA